MILDITMYKLSPLRKRLLIADLNHMELCLLDEMHSTIEKLRGDKNTMWKIVSKLSRFSGLSHLTTDTLLTGLELLERMDMLIVQHTLKKEEPFRVEIKVEDIYFDLFEKMPVMGKFLTVVTGGKKEFIEKIRKTIEQEYTKDFDLKIIEEVVPNL